MKKLFVFLSFVLVGTIVPINKALAQDPITLIIKEGIKKVIKAVDLQIQRNQNKVIWLQNAQKTLENTVSKLRLDEITSWVEKQKTLYQDYYEELQQVKAIVSYYNRIKEVTGKQLRLVEEYKRAWGLFKQDDHFTAGELRYMRGVYAGILDESVKNLDQLFIVIHSFQTQMSDAERLQIINAAADGIDSNYDDMKRFNQQAIVVSLQRAKAQNDVNAIRKLYGLQ